MMNWHLLVILVALLFAAIGLVAGLLGRRGL
jgi:hypothetical protein